MRKQLYMVEFDGTTFGMEVQNSEAFKRMKKNIFKHMFWRRGYPRYKLCVKASDLAAVMGEAGWHVSEPKLMERVRWDDTWYWVYYGEPIKQALGPYLFFN